MNIKEFINSRFSTMPRGKRYIILEIRNDEIRQALLQAYNYPIIAPSDKIAWVEQSSIDVLYTTGTPFHEFKSRYRSIVHDISDSICIQPTKPIKIYKKD